MAFKTTLELTLEGIQARKYKPEYALQLAAHLRAGKSFECFNVDPRVARSTIRQWVLDHEEFMLAKEQGEDDFQELLEAVAYAKTLGFDLPKLKAMGATGKIDTEMLRFIFKNRFRRSYSEKIENVVQNPDGSAMQPGQINLDLLSMKELKAMRDMVQKAQVKDE